MSSTLVAGSIALGSGLVIGLMGLLTVDEAATPGGVILGVILALGGFALTAVGFDALGVMG